MFTGIIQETGEITKISQGAKSTLFNVKAKKSVKGSKIGDSIAVNGVCTTIINLDDEVFSFEAIPETLEITNFKDLKIRDQINIEKAMTLSDGIHGHLIQGHVDALGTVSELAKEKDKVRLKLKFPQSIADLLAFKGSITINGISLTISDLQEDNLSVDLIPHTLKNTNFKYLEKGDRVNLETDLIARHLKTLLDHKEKEAKYEFLKERNLI